MSGRIHSLARAAGSHGVTLALLAGMALAIAAGLAGILAIADWVALPLAGLAVNLAAALAANGSLRAQPMLYAFHVMIGLLVVVIGIDHLTALRGHVEVTEGALFDPALAEVEAGPLHPNALDSVAFVQGGFEIRYLPGMKRRETVSFLRVPAGNGTWAEARVGDDDPLVVGAYRFYTSFNKGFAPVLTYTGADGHGATGAVHMPSYPLRDFEQGNSFTPPGGQPVKLWLRLDEPVYDPEAEWVFRKPQNPVLVVLAGDRRHEIGIGGAAELPGGGQLRFDALRTWMGYTISANLLTSWMIAISIIACIALVAHVWEKFAPAAAAARPGSEVRDAR